MKLLGFIFSESPDCNLQVTNLIRKASQRKYLLRRYSKFMGGDDLKKLYCVLVRSILEYSAVTYTTQISKYQSNRLENVQKQCLKTMYGYDKTYEQLLQCSGLESLKDRRNKLFQNFAQKIVKNPNYADLFPLNNSIQNTRRPKVYREIFAKTDRLYNSPLYAMRRFLNQTPEHSRFNNPNYVDLSDLFNDPNS